MQTDFAETDQDDRTIDRGKELPPVAAQAEHSDASARERSATRMGGRKTDKSVAEKELPPLPGQAPEGRANPRTDAGLDYPAEVKKSRAKTPKSKPNIVVRLPVEDDRDAVRALARKLHNLTIFSDIGFSDTKFDKYFDRALTRPKHMSGLVAELVPSVAGQAPVRSAGPRTEPKAASELRAAADAARPRRPGAAGMAVSHGNSPEGGAKNNKTEKYIIGGAWVTAGEYIIGEGEVLTTVHAIGVDVEYCGMLLSGKTFLRLIQAIKKWGEMRGSTRTLVHVTTGSNLAATDRLMRASGAKCIGGGYVV